MRQTLSKLLEGAVRQDTPILIVLDGQNWWDYRSDLWNWWDPSKPGYNPENVLNVEWTGWTPNSAVKIAWRNWGRQIRVLPPPNLESKRFRDASKVELVALLRIIKAWYAALPAGKHYLFPGVKIGWEASVGINAYYYPGGNEIYEKNPDTDAGDPKYGLNLTEGLAGGLAPLGFSALNSLGRTHSEGYTITGPDHEEVVSRYLTFLGEICANAGFGREQVFTHAGGQYAPYDLHVSHKVAINRYTTPGWSLYGVTPDKAGDLGASLDAAHLDSWCAAEWLPSATTAEDWRKAILTTLQYKRCRFLSLYNWEGIRDNAEAIEGLQAALSGAEALKSN